MKKSNLLLILFLMLIIVPLKAMDLLDSETKELYKNLQINLEDLKGKTKEERFEMIIKAYRKLALKYHPDRPGGDKEKFLKVTEAREKLEKLLAESADFGPILKQILKQIAQKDRSDSLALMAKAEEAAKKDQLDEARTLYSNATIPFLSGTIMGRTRFSGEDAYQYGLDIISLAHFNTIDSYYKQLEYDYAVFNGKQFLATLQDIINKINLAVSQEGMSYFTKYNLSGYDAEKNYKLLLGNFEKLKNIVGLAFDELKKNFIKDIWKPMVKPVLIEEPKKITDRSMEIIKSSLELAENEFKWEYTVNGTSKVMLDPIQKNEYVKGYLKLADGYLTLKNETEARKALEDGLKINNTLYAEKKISIDFKNEFESRLLNLMKPKEAVSSDKDLINALIQLNSKLDQLHKKLSNLS